MIVEQVVEDYGMKEEVFVVFMSMFSSEVFCGVVVVDFVKWLGVQL